ncbi:hypothetical protein FISHEDRAFT_74668 [Fistulina hepatica ATCC 64428]|uniref:Uncharacterized protein n=1 Tax=Fistulina hepatica ATCC 64428 TaxID=1128425 RepID=A0A0D7A9M3_9AGAR|nr:hypothetical protein FISHEDRAFT_74668 [Fistulina hepatica ATCC 64428]
MSGNSTRQPFPRPRVRAPRQRSPTHPTDPLFARELPALEGGTDEVMDLIRRECRQQERAFRMRWEDEQKLREAEIEARWQNRLSDLVKQWTQERDMCFANLRMQWARLIHEENERHACATADALRAQERRLNQRWQAELARNMTLSVPVSQCDRHNFSHCARLSADTRSDVPSEGELSLMTHIRLLEDVLNNICPPFMHSSTPTADSGFSERICGIVDDRDARSAHVLDSESCRKASSRKSVDSPIFADDRSPSDTSAHSPRATDVFSPISSLISPELRLREQLVSEITRRIALESEYDACRAEIRCLRYGLMTSWQQSAVARASPQVGAESILQYPGELEPLSINLSVPFDDGSTTSRSAEKVTKRKKKKRQTCEKAKPYALPPLRRFSLRRRKPKVKVHKLMDSEAVLVRLLTRGIVTPELPPTH